MLNIRLTSFACMLSHVVASRLHLPLPAWHASSNCNPKHNSSKVAGGKVLVYQAFPRPPSERDDTESLCCSIGNGRVGVSEAITFVDAGPSKTHKGENDYLCTLYEADPTDAKGLRIVPGNTSSTAAIVSFLPDQDPHCELKKTMAECWEKPKGSPYSNCAWWGEACHDSPPGECATIPEMQTDKKPFCVSVALAPGPIPASSTSPGRPLRPFNWTSGTISGPKSLHVTTMPTQVLKEGDATWWSVEGGGNAIWETCVQYNELLADGSSSDPNSGFKACATYTGNAGFDLQHGNTSGIAYIAGSGLEAAGHPDAKSERVFWVQFAFWSDSKSALVGNKDGDTAFRHSLNLPAARLMLEK